MRVFVATAALLASLSAAAAGDPAAGEAKAAACAACHGPAGTAPIAPNYPVIGGQYATYLEKALEQYKSGDRKNPIMAGQVASLSEQDMKDLAAYFAAQSGPLTTPNYAQ